MAGDALSAARWKAGTELAVGAPAFMRGKEALLSAPGRAVFDPAL